MKRLMCCLFSHHRSTGFLSIERSSRGRCRFHRVQRRGTEAPGYSVSGSRPTPRFHPALIPPTDPGTGRALIARFRTARSSLTPHHLPIHQRPLPSSDRQASQHQGPKLPSQKGPPLPSLLVQHKKLSRDRVVSLRRKSPNQTLIGTLIQWHGQARRSRFLQPHPRRPDPGRYGREARNHQSCWTPRSWSFSF